MASGCQPKDLKCNRPRKLETKQCAIKISSSPIQANIHELEKRTGFPIVGSCLYLSDLNGNFNWELVGDVDLMNIGDKRDYPKILDNKPCHTLNYFDLNHAIYMLVTHLDNNILWITQDRMTKEKKIKRFIQLLYYYADDSQRMRVIRAWDKPLGYYWGAYWINEYKWQMAEWVKLPFQDKCDMAIRKFVK